MVVTTYEGQHNHHSPALLRAGIVPPIGTLSSPHDNASRLNQLQYADILNNVMPNSSQFAFPSQNSSQENYHFQNDQQKHYQNQPQHMATTSLPRLIPPHSSQQTQLRQINHSKTLDQFSRGGGLQYGSISTTTNSSEGLLEDLISFGTSGTLSS